MIASTKLKHSIQCDLKVSDRILRITLGTPDGNLLIVGAYAPHGGHTVSAYNLFLSTLQAVLDKNTCKRRIILGDLNAKVARNTPGIAGKFGLHHYNSRNGRLLAHFCQHNNLIIANFTRRTAPTNIGTNGVKSTSSSQTVRGNHAVPSTRYIGTSLN